MAKATYQGLLFIFAETGTEGWLWAIQENYLKKNWSYEDLQIIENGDHLTIYDPNGKEIWSDTVSMRYNDLYEIENIHYWPTNFDKNEWIKIFCAANKDLTYKKVYTAKLTKNVSLNQSG